MFSLKKLTIAAVAAVLVMTGAAQVQAAPKGSIVVDMRDGKVLYSRSADRKLHPASLTKMMTLYLTFDAIKRGKIRLDQKVRISRKAARMTGSRLRLRAGQRVTIRSLIRATAIKSANDAAMALAEAVGGSQANFARMMTRQAQRLGMRNTRFKNPHGLTQRGHYSTPRDMAILARHLFFDFPQFYNIFKRKTDTAAGKRIWTTNRLLSSYPGADGIKTGYTRAAGYNLVASAHRGGKRIIAVAFGERNSRARTAKVSRLLDIGFQRAGGKVRVRKPQTVVAETKRRAGRVVVKMAPLPPRRPGMRTSVTAAITEVLSSPAAAATVPNNGGSKRASGYAPRIAGLPVPRKATVRRMAAKARAARRDKAPAGVRADVPIPIPRPVK